MLSDNEKNTAQTSSRNAQRNLVAFQLGKQVYAMPIDIILQIIEMVTITPIPQVNSVVAGAINVRGEALPVINLRRYLGLPERELELHTPIILVQVQNPDAESVRQKIGLIVDEVIDVLSMLDDHVTPLPDILPEELRNAPIVQGLVHTSYGMVVLLELNELFSAQSRLHLPMVEESASTSIAPIPNASEPRRLLAEVRA